MFSSRIPSQVLQRPLIVRFTCSEIGEVVKGIPNLCICLYGRATHQTPQIGTHISSLLFIYNSHITYNLTFPTHRLHLTKRCQQTASTSMSRALMLRDNGSLLIVYCSLFTVNCSVMTYDVIHHIHNIII